MLLVNIVLYGWVVPEVADVLALTYIEHTMPPLLARPPDAPAYAPLSAAVAVQTSVAKYRKTRNFFVNTMALRLNDAATTIGASEPVRVIRATHGAVTRFATRTIRKVGLAVYGLLLLGGAVLLCLLLAVLERCVVK